MVIEMCVKLGSFGEKTGACAVMALERVPADIRAQGGVARMPAHILFEDVNLDCEL